MPIKSPVPDVSIKELSLVDFVLQPARELGDKPALIDGPSGRTVTFGQLADGVDAVARGLHSRGFTTGDVLAIFSPNLPEYAVAYHAAVRLGGIVTTANPLYTSEELAFQLTDARAKFLLTIPQFIDTALESARQTSVEEVFVFGEAEGATPFASLFKPEGELPDVEFGFDDVVALPYSSGTTGLPKGVMLTHRNLVGNIHQTLAVHRVSERDTLIAVLPMFHLYGQQVIMNEGLSQGATLVTMPRFDLEQFLHLIQEYKVTRAYLVPPIVLALAKHPIVDNYDLSSLELILSGAAPLGSDLQEAVRERIGCPALQGYGLSETGPVTNIIPDDGEVKAGSVGSLIPNTEA
ncbi:MAG: AMP-binding protein, partial [Actinomycetota bacterium]